MTPLKRIAHLWLLLLAAAAIAPARAEEPTDPPPKPFAVVLIDGLEIARYRLTAAELEAALARVSS